MLDAYRLPFTHPLQTGEWFRRNTTDCQEMGQQKHDNNFSQKNALRSQFLDCFSLLSRAGDRSTCRSAMPSPSWLFEGGVSHENGRGVQEDLRLAAHFYRLATAWHHVAAQYNLALMMANGKGVTHYPERALTLILIAKQNTGLNHNARLRLTRISNGHRGAAE